MTNPSPARGWVFFAVGLVAAYAAGVGLVYAVSGTLTYVHLVPILLATVVSATTMSWGMTGLSRGYCIRWPGARDVEEDHERGARGSLDGTLKRTQFGASARNKPLRPRQDLPTGRDVSQPVYLSPPSA